MPKARTDWTPKAIMAFRLWLRMSKVGFGLRVHVTAGAVRYWEQGKRSPDWSSLRALDALAEGEGYE